jgi:hypothetical protein
MGVAVVLMTVAAPRQLPAQQPQVRFGQWVRVVSTTDSTVAQGRLILVVPDTVVLEHGQRQEYAAVGSHGRLEVPRHVRSHTLLGALLGAGVGAGAGALSWSLGSMFTCLDFSCGPPSGQVIGRSARVLIGGLVGLGIGALVGAHVYTTVWDPVPADQLERLRVGMAPQPGIRLGLGASLRF